MACERYLNAINELVDGTLGSLRRAELELHLESCEACSALLADLREIARAAHSLEDLQPPPHVWTQVVDRLRQEGRVSGRTAMMRPSYTVLALAAALVLAVGASLLLLMPRNGAQSPAAEQGAAAPAPSPATAGNPAGDTAVQDGTETLTATLDELGRNTTTLIEEVKKRGYPARDVATIQQSASSINDAIYTVRKVLDSDAQNEAARESYYQLLRQKIRFLQDTIALLNEMRQGDAAGAAEIVEGGKS